MASGGLVHMIRCSLTWAGSLATGTMSLRQSLYHFAPSEQVQRRYPSPLRTGTSNHACGGSITSSIGKASALSEQVEL